MKRTRQTILILLVCGGTFFVIYSISAASEKKPAHTMDHWDDPYDCVGCHRERYADWSSSQMSRAYTGDFFQAQFFQYVVKDAARDPEVKDAAADCIGCHSPSAFLSDLLLPPKSSLLDNFWEPEWPWLDSYRAVEQVKSALKRDELGRPAALAYRNRLPRPKQGVDRGGLLRFLSLDPELLGS